jgi:prevent-host-death family protein
LTNLTNSVATATIDVMPKVNLYEAKTNLSELVERAAAGEEVIIAKAGKPRARLVALGVAATERRPGRARGRIRIAADFDAPLPPEIAEAFGS